MDLDHSQRTDDILRRLNVLPGGKSHPIGVVVAECHGVRAAFEGCFHDILDRKADPVAGALSKPEGRLDPAAAVQHHQHGTLPVSPGKFPQQETRQLVGRAHGSPLSGAAAMIVSADFGQKMQHPRRGRADPLHPEQIFLRCVQHPGEIPKPLDQRMGDAVGVLLGVGDVEQHFQCLVGSQRFKTLFGDSLPHPLAVPLMNLRSVCHSRAPLGVYFL